MYLLLNIYDGAYIHQTPDLCVRLYRAFLGPAQVNQAGPERQAVPTQPVYRSLGHLPLS